MEQEAPQAQHAAPPVEQRPAPVAQPHAPAAAVTGGHGNAAVARMAGTPGTALSPSVVRALAPHTGNATIARMLEGPRTVAREGPGGAPPAPAAAGGAPATAKPGAPPALALPGGIPLVLPQGPGTVASTPKVDKTIKSIDKKFGITVPLGPLQGEIGGTLIGLARYAGGMDVHWDRPSAPVTDPAAVKDTVSVKNATIGATGSVAGGIFGSIGLGSRLIAGTRVSARGTVKADASGTLTANGAVTRDGVDGKWTGGIGWEAKAQGTLTAAAQGFFEWNLLWLEGHREIFRLESFPLATITVRLAGQLMPNGTVTTTARDFTLQLGSPPQPKQVGGAPAPAGGQPAKVAPKRQSADVPPDDPKPGANVLAREPAGQPDGAQPAPAGDQPAAAPGAPAAPAPGPGGDEGKRTPDQIAAGTPTGDVASELVPSPEPEGVDP